MWPETRQLECWAERFQNEFKTQQSRAFCGPKARSQKQIRSVFPLDLETHQNKAGWEERGRRREKQVWALRKWLQLPSHLYLQLTQKRGELESSSKAGIKGQLFISPKEQLAGAQRALRSLVHSSDPAGEVSGGHHPGGSQQSTPAPGNSHSQPVVFLMHLKLGVF